MVKTISLKETAPKGEIRMRKAKAGLGAEPAIEDPFSKIMVKDALGRFPADECGVLKIRCTDGIMATALIAEAKERGLNYTIIGTAPGAETKTIFDMIAVRNQLSGTPEEKQKAALLEICNSLAPEGIFLAQEKIVSPALQASVMSIFSMLEEFAGRDPAKHGGYYIPTQEELTKSSQDAGFAQVIGKISALTINTMDWFNAFRKAKLSTRESNMAVTAINEYVMDLSGPFKKALNARPDETGKGVLMDLSVFGMIASKVAGMLE
jgi:hypothetical protein